MLSIRAYVAVLSAIIGTTFYAVGLEAAAIPLLVVCGNAISAVCAEIIRDHRG